MSTREFVKKMLKSSSIGKVMYEPLHKCWKMYNDPRRRHKLRKYGMETLEVLHKFFTDNDIKYYLDYGTLLGVIRENGFIKHDDDIDLTIRYSKFTPKELINKLKEIGFNFVHGFHIDNKTNEFTVERKGLTVDFFLASESDDLDSYYMHTCYYEPERKYPTENANSCKLWFYPKNLAPIEYIFQGVQVCVPDDAERLLSIEYGEGWKYPIKNFIREKEITNFKEIESFAYREIIPDKLPN